jgi:hypothetical protein
MQQENATVSRFRRAFGLLSACSLLLAVGSLGAQFMGVGVPLIAGTRDGSYVLPPEVVFGLAWGSYSVPFAYLFLVFAALPYIWFVALVGTWWWKLVRRPSAA